MDYYSNPNFIRYGSPNGAFYSIHPHVLNLTYKKEFHCNGGCDKLHKLENSYYCQICDFDCCMNCLYKFKDLPINSCSPCFFPSIHIHPLQLKKRSYNCNVGCGGFYFYTNSFYCQICDFNCCPNCVMKHGFMRAF